MLMSSLVVTHQYNTSRESLLPLFDTALQSQRSLPEATAMDLFVRLHGMLFTRIDLDNFSSVMSRFMERLDEDARLDGVSRKVSISQVDWIIMASVNIAAVLQYGAQSGIIRKALSVEGQERRKAHAVAGDDEEDADAGEHPDQQSSDDAAPVDDMPEVTPTYLEAIHLTFAMLKFTLKRPTRQQGLHSVLNPYITVVLTFLATLCRQPHVATLIIDRLPWNELSVFASNVGDIKEETRLLAGPPLPEDWACRGMEWVGRRLYERGFWKAKPAGRGSGAMAQPRSGERFQSEMDVLTADFDSTVDISEGVVDEVEGTDLTDGPVAVNQRRWKRVVWAIGVMTKHIDGLSVHGAEVVVEGALQRRLAEVERVKKAEEEQEKRRLQARRERERLEEEAELAEALAELGDEEDSRVVRVSLASGRLWLLADVRRSDVRSNPALGNDDLSERHCMLYPATRCLFWIPTSCFLRSKVSHASSKVANGALSFRCQWSPSWTVCRKTSLRLGFPPSRRYRISSRRFGRTPCASKSRRLGATTYQTCSFGQSMSTFQTRNWRAETWTI